MSSVPSPMRTAAWLLSPEVMTVAPVNETEEFSTSSTRPDDSTVREELARTP
ncbi:Uncharacterised protein [Delftia tsuruhatensis]|nr:Uncharacterised protein [Delftia tsuruhatensis]